MLRFFFVGLYDSWEVNRLVNPHVHFFNNNAIGWNSISHSQLNDVSDHELPDWNLGNCAVSTPVNSYLLVIDLVLQIEVLPLLNPITQG